MALNFQDIFKQMSAIRFADIICAYDGQPYSTKVTTYPKVGSGVIEFHIPARCSEIVSAIEAESSIMMKYSTEYAEASCE